MGERKKPYVERELCPEVVHASWWYTLPSVTRRRIRELTQLGVIAGTTLIGVVQDALIDAGHKQLAARFMRAMQDAKDAEAAADARAEARMAEEINAPLLPVTPDIDPLR